jgi:GDP-mannose 6-dehydrogenase
VNKFNFALPQIIPKFADAFNERRVPKRRYGQVHNGHTGSLQIGRAHAFRAEAGQMRLKPGAVQKPRGFYSLPFAATNAQRSHHDQNRNCHEVARRTFTRIPASGEANDAAWDTVNVSQGVNSPAFQPRNVAVAGLGYVGCVTAACLASLGHKVVGVDRDEKKVRAVNEGRSPFFEPGLEEIIRTCAADGRLSAVSRVEEAVGQSDIVLVCVGTPSEKNGNFGLEQLRRVTEEIAATLSERTRGKLIVAIRSTVYPGTCEDVVAPLLGNAERAVVVDNPEFLREGSAVRDFVEPSLLVIGGTDAEAMRTVAALYSPLPVEPCLVSTKTAEMIKYACNSYHAVKVAFANEIGSLCDRMGISGREVMETFCKDTRLNISPAYLRPGFAFGGSCLPKDLRALTFRANRLDVKVPLLDSVLPSNDRHLQRAIDAVMDLPVSRIGIYGLAFKENTDDLRESPVVSLLEYLIGKGKDVRVFDPHIQIDEIYGTNRSFIMQAVPHIGRLMCAPLDELLKWSEHIVITQNPPAALREKLLGSGIPLLDLAGAFPGSAAQAKPLAQAPGV